MSENRSIVEWFKPNKNGWHEIKGIKHTYYVGTNFEGNTILECDTGEATVVDKETWFYRKENIDRFWNKHF